MKMWNYKLLLIKITYTLIICFVIFIREFFSNHFK